MPRCLLVPRAYTNTDYRCLAWAGYAYGEWDEKEKCSGSTSTYRLGLQVVRAASASVGRERRTPDGRRGMAPSLRPQSRWKKAGRTQEEAGRYLAAASASACCARKHAAPVTGGQQQTRSLDDFSEGRQARLRWRVRVYCIHIASQTRPPAAVARISLLFISSFQPGLSSPSSLACLLACRRCPAQRTVPQHQHQLSLQRLPCAPSR